jgi:predicted flap endonuclease-1-like 5' DNA nuclease
MIWHFLEVWALVAAAFAVGSGLGALAYSGLSRGRFAEAQGAFADAVGDRVDGLKMRFGAEPAWRPGVKRAAARTSRENRQFRRDADFGGALGDRFAAAPARPAPRRPLAYWAAREMDPPDPLTAPAHDEDHAPLAGDAEDAADIADLVEDVPAPEAEGGPARADLPAMRPIGLTQPRNGIPDNLQKIRGIGRRNEQLLHSLGIYHFGQIAAWTPAEARWVAAFLSFPERIERDDWIGQATILASGGDTGYVKPIRRDDDDDEMG